MARTRWMATPPPGHEPGADGEPVGHTILRLVTRPHLQLRPHGEMVHIDRFEAWLDGTLICISRQPRLDAARELLRLGYSPSMLMTTRAHDRNYDSWTPAPLGELAKWTVAEMSGRGLRRLRWQPFQKGDSMCAVRPGMHEVALGGGMVPDALDARKREGPGHSAGSGQGL